MATTTKEKLRLVVNNTVTIGVWPGGKGMFIAEGTWGGGNVKLQMQAGNGTYVDIANTTISANGAILIDLPNGQVKAVVTTATGVYADLIHVPI